MSDNILGLADKYARQSGKYAGTLSAICVLVRIEQNETNPDLLRKRLLEIGAMANRALEENGDKVLA